MRNRQFCWNSMHSQPPEINKYFIPGKKKGRGGILHLQSFLTKKVLSWNKSQEWTFFMLRHSSCYFVHQSFQDSAIQSAPRIFSPKPAKLKYVVIHSQQKKVKIVNIWSQHTSFRTKWKIHGNWKDHSPVTSHEPTRELHHSAGQCKGFPEINVV